MYTLTFDPNMGKTEFYRELLSQLTLILNGQRNWVTNLANASSLIFHGMNSILVFNEKINWVGFYVAFDGNKSSDVLMLGPFQGKVACEQIRIGKGVCGTAAATGQTQVVADVHDFPGHIACDSGSNSEIVVPIFSDQAAIGVLDIDCLAKGGFDVEDKIGLEKISELIANACDWPVVADPLTRA